MGQRTREKEDADINVKSSNASIKIKSSDTLSCNYKDAIKDELSGLKDKIAAIEDDRQPSSKHRRKISVKVYV